MAQEVEVNETCTEEAIPLEFKMTGNYSLFQFAAYSSASWNFFDFITLLAASDHLSATEAL